MVSHRLIVGIILGELMNLVWVPHYTRNKLIISNLTAKRCVQENCILNVQNMTWNDSQVFYTPAELSRFSFYIKITSENVVYEQTYIIVYCRYKQTRLHAIVLMWFTLHTTAVSTRSIINLLFKCAKWTPYGLHRIYSHMHKYWYWLLEN